MAQQALGLSEQLQRELDSLREQLAWSNRLSQLGVLTAALAHETNNLLVPIGSYAQLAKANPGDERLTQLALNAAITGSKKVAKLVESVVSLASPGKVELQTSCQVNVVVEDAIACMLPIIKQHGVNVISRVEPACVSIDALALEQVMVNLISNACHAMSKMNSKREIIIESQQGENILTLSVSDSGPGIAEAVIDHLFEPFITQQDKQAIETGRQTPTQEPMGTGLGLSICKQLVESAGGQIMLAEQQKLGASFVIKLLSSD